MACRKCGSSWITKTGKDCSSCPYCCKQQRCKARKQGRWQESNNCERTCEVCRKAFFSTHNKQKCCSNKCQRVNRKQWLAEWLPEYNKQYKAGRKRGTQAQKNARQCKCQMCGVSFERRGPKKYCSRACFIAARKCGVQSWDRTNQTEATWHRGGQWKNAPSKRHAASVRRLQSWLNKASSLWQRMLRLHEMQRQCEVCSTACNKGASRFCSYKCAKDWRGDRACVVCSVVVHDCKSQGKVFCLKCKAEAKRRYRRKYKRELGSHRKKVRKGGGFWNSKVRRSVVLSRDQYRCYLCNAKCKVGWKYNDPKCATVDMVVPACKGGDWDYHNLRCACRECNSRKAGTLTGQLTLHMRA
jgi:hypothetical protein